MGSAYYADCLKEKFGKVCWENMNGDILDDSATLCEYEGGKCNDTLDKVFYYHPVKCKL